MYENIYRYFTLENSLAAISAIPFTDHTLATDGYNCQIHKINLQGDTVCRYDTLRPLRRLRQGEGACYITALGCCNDIRLYFLDENLREVGFVQLKTPRICGCTINGFDEITDASVVEMNGTSYIVASSVKGAYLFDLNGKYLETLCVADANEILTDFVYLKNGYFAMATLCGSKQTLTIANESKSQSLVLDRGLVLRMLIPTESGLYALFGESYIYNRIIKLNPENIYPPLP